ncbi:MAG: HD-GYP domain-containing protein [Peptococcaceae bacterium]|nr:HD-GYP domain-containing protein [Peptococcaceae bacterium]
MRRVPTHALAPGMEVARSVFNRNGQVLLTAGTILTRRFIEKLIILGIPALYVEDGLLPDIEIDDVINDKTRMKAISNVRNLIGAGNRGIGGVVKKAAILSREISANISEIVDQLLANRQVMVNLVDIRTYDEYTFNHSVNVCVLSVLTGIALGYGRDKLSVLAMGALLHDVGKIQVSRELLEKPGGLSPEEYESVKKHSQYGFEIIKSSFITDIVAASVALQHHERFDGQGYPNGLKGKQIHEFSRIAGIADTYDAITSDRVYRKAIPPNEAYEFISSCGGIRFDDDITKAFLEHIPAYPVGTIVVLNNNEVGAVVENIKGYSRFPRVRILFSGDGRYAKNYREVWLAEEPDLYIVRTAADIKEVFASGELRKKA